MKFLGKEIGDGHPTLVLAECGINHNGKLDVALKMIDIAKECGADAVKFQKRDLASLYRADVLAEPSNESHSLGVYIPILRECELNEAAHRQLKKHCDEIGIKYLCSPWDLPSLRFLVDDLHVEGLKVPSACLSDAYLLREIVATKLPFIVSTGMHCESEIEEIFSLIKSFPDGDAAFTQRMACLHCVSSYPTANRDVNLGYMKMLKEKHRIPIGYSGHERGIPISVAAVAMGANIIERHFTLDRTWKGPDHAASLEPHGLEELVRHIRAVEESLGSRKNVNQGEVVARETLGKILIWANDFPAGHVLHQNDFIAQSPGYGIPPCKAHMADRDGVAWMTRVSVKKGFPVKKEEVEHLLKVRVTLEDKNAQRN